MVNPILVIDNDAYFLASLLPLLGSELKLKPLVAQNGKDGLSRFDEKLISLILLDLDLPDICGLDVLKSIREKCRRTTVCIVTGKSNHKLAVACAGLSVQGYFEKPVHPSFVVQEVKKHLNLLYANHFKHFFGDEYEAKLASLSSTVKKALDYVHLNINLNFQRNDIAANAHVSPDYLSRIFHENCGIKLMDYIISCRIYTAKELLLSRTHLKIKNIARMVGMKDVAHFCRCFKKSVGLTPANFRNKRLL